MNEIAATSRQKRQAKTASRAGQVTGLLKAACDYMVHDALPWEKAAEKAGLQVRSMRLALGRKHVTQYIADERKRLLAALCSANPVRLAELRDQNDNKAAAVNAIKELEAMNDLQPGAIPGRAQSPGVVIVIQQGAPAAPAGPTITLTPNGQRFVSDEREIIEAE